MPLQSWLWTPTFLGCTQVGELDMLWDSENGSSASVPEQRLRVEREREIACYLLLVSSLQQESCPN